LQLIQEKEISQNSEWKKEEEENENMKMKLTTNNDRTNKRKLPALN
jgi:hypothetical protein